MFFVMAQEHTGDWRFLHNGTSRADANEACHAAVSTKEYREVHVAVTVMLHLDEVMNENADDS